MRKSKKTEESRRAFIKQGLVASSFLLFPDTYWVAPAIQHPVID